MISDVAVEDDDPSRVIDAEELTAAEGREGSTAELYLLYNYEVDNTRVVAIATMMESADTLPNDPMFRVIEALSVEERDGDGEPLTRNSVVRWPIDRATSGQGNTVEAIKFRSKFFERYLKDRRHQREEWLRKISGQQLEKGKFSAKTLLSVYSSCNL